MRVPVAAGVAALGLALQACAAGPQLSPSDHRAAIRQMASDTLTQLYQSYPDTQSRIRTAAGDAVFSDVGMKMFYGGQPMAGASPSTTPRSRTP
jgi:hypothetical protein